MAVQVGYLPDEPQRTSPGSPDRGRFNDTNIAVAASTSYSLTNVEPADTGAYSADVSHAVDLVGSLEARRVRATLDTPLFRCPISTDMKRDSLLKLAIPTFLVALAAYVITFAVIEQRRVRKGPWQVTFENREGTPMLRINQPSLGITNVQIVFAGRSIPDTNSPQTMEFAQARAVPFAVPFGECVFQDTLFLPGTVALVLFDHQIQLIPRTLTIDGVEHPWRSGGTFALKTNSNPLSAPK